MDKLLTRKEANCSTCSSTTSAEKLYVFINGLYIPPSKHFAKERNFCFCALMKYFEKKQCMNNIQNPPIIVEVRKLRLTKDERNLLHSRGFPKKIITIGKILCVQVFLQRCSSLYLSNKHLSALIFTFLFLSLLG